MAANDVDTHLPGGAPVTDQEIRAWVLASKVGDGSSRERLIAACRPFVRLVAMQVCRRPLHWENDDELSVALIALNEAVDSYDPDQGEFLPHARRVIQRRLVDFLRRERRFRAVLSLEAAGDQEEGDPHYLERAEAARVFNTAEAVRARAEEIRRFGEILAEYGLSWADLLASAPRHRDTRARLTAIARVLATNQALVERLRRTRQLPLRELAALTGASRKVLESGRRYILALALLQIYDEFEHLRSFAGLLEAEVGAPVAVALEHRPSRGR